MKSKTSWFNTTIFLKNVTRLWPIWAVYLIYLFFTGPFVLYIDTNNVDHETQIDTLRPLLNDMAALINPISIFVFAMSVSILIFSYLFKSRDCNMIHALPVRREELLTTGFVSGMAFLFVPQVVQFIMNVIVCIINGVPDMKYLIAGLGICLVLDFVFISMAIFCIMLTGNPIAGVAYYVGFNLVYIAYKALIMSLLSILSYGITAETLQISVLSWDAAFSPVIYLAANINVNYDYSYKTTSASDSQMIIENVYFEGMGVLAVFAVVGAVLLICAFILYKKRQLECAGEMAAFKAVKPVVRWMVTVGASIGCAMIIKEMFKVDTTRGEFMMILILSIIFSVGLFIACRMILERKFRIFTRKMWIEWASCAVVTALLVIGANSDIFGVETYIPEEDDINYIFVTSSDIDMYVTDSDDIAKVRDIHQTILDNKEEYQEMYTEYLNQVYSSSDIQNFTSEYTYTINYYLKNGKHVIRSYDIPADVQSMKDSSSAAYKIAKLETADAMLKSRICMEYDECEPYAGTYDHYDKQTDGDISESLTTDESKEIYEAFLKDIEEGNYPYGIRDYADYDVSYYDSLNISLKGPVDMQQVWSYYQSQSSDSIYSINPGSVNSYDVTEIDEDGSISNYSSTSVYIYIYPGCENLINAMIDVGLIDSEDDLMTYDDTSYY